MVPIIIPAYEPDFRILKLLDELILNNIDNIIVVNDGSGREYDNIFDSVETKLKEIKDGVLLSHDINRGKGRALKTAFQYILDNYPDAIGAVTADSDGQHSVDCIKKIIDGLQNNRKSLILGVRAFDLNDIPWKSRFGNRLTIKTLKIVSGLDVSDTQTGLRGIPREFIRQLIDVKGERFEFEMRMLLESVGHYPIVEIPIETIYDSKENHQTHFNPVADSVKIYKILFEEFSRFVLSALTSFAVDVLLFTLFCKFLKRHDISAYIAVSTVLARIVSSAYNYLMNHFFVFKSGDRGTKTAPKYFLLVIVQMGLSALFVTIGCMILPVIHENIVKIIVDTILFFISYKIQKKFVF